jgi:hypothetical protein
LIAMTMKMVTTGSEVRAYRRNEDDNDDEAARDWFDDEKDEVHEDR